MTTSTSKYYFSYLIDSKSEISTKKHDIIISSSRDLTQVSHLPVFGWKFGLKYSMGLLTIKTCTTHFKT